MLKQEDLKDGKLENNSILLIPKFSVIHKDLIIKNIWKLKREKLLEISNIVCKKLWC